MGDTDFLLTKARVSQKVQTLLNQTHDQLKQYVAAERFTFPEGTSAQAGKIARGENYRQLPYLLLDYPRLFAREDVFALRTMFWWGQFFSVTFQLGGEIVATVPAGPTRQRRGTGGHCGIVVYRRRSVATSSRTVLLPAHRRCECGGGASTTTSSTLFEGGGIFTTGRVVVATGPSITFFSTNGLPHRTYLNN